MQLESKRNDKILERGSFARFSVLARKLHGGIARGEDRRTLREGVEHGPPQP